MTMTDDELQRMPWTSGLMTGEELAAWVATREAAGRAIDIETCEIGRWPAYDLDPYGVRADLPDEMKQIGTNRLVRSPESSGWVWEGDLPPAKVGAMYDRIAREWALWEAAIDRHPGWRSGLYRNPAKIDGTAPDYPELLEWFRRSFPDETRAIEVRVGEDQVRRRQQEYKEDDLPF